MRARTALPCLLAATLAATTACEQVNAPRGDVPTEIEATRGANGGDTWSVPGDFATIQEAIDDPAVLPGHTIVVRSGNHAGAVVTKAVHIRGQGNATIDDGPVFVPNHHLGGELNYGFVLPDDFSVNGASISHLSFESVEFPVFSRGANGIAVSHNSFRGAVQAVSNWRGSGWTIEHNTIEGLRSINGGGIGILLGDLSALAAGVRDNVVSHNRIEGTLQVHPDDGGGYDGTGIVLYADFRGSRAGAAAISGNRVVGNRISVNSDTPDVVGFNGIELTDTRDDGSLDPVIFDNAVGFNDYRGSDNGLALTPSNLDDVNDISRNLGENRGDGQHPSAFGPGGS